MSKLLTYIVTNDTGLAPNPYWGWCTLAVCTPNHQGARLKSGDRIAGFLSSHRQHRLLYAMEVSEKRIPMDKYFHDERFSAKRPNLLGDWKARCGDNFYSRNLDGTWRPHRNRFHRGTDYLHKDTRSPFVFVAQRYWYFGRNAVTTPDEFLCLVGRRGIRTKHPPGLPEKFRKWIEASFNQGIRVPGQVVPASSNAPEITLMARDRRSRKAKGLRQIFLFEVRVLPQNIFPLRKPGHKFEHPPHRDTHAANTRLPLAFASLNGDPVEVGNRRHFDLSLALLPYRSGPSTTTPPKRIGYSRNNRLFSGYLSFNFLCYRKDARSPHIYRAARHGRGDHVIVTEPGQQARLIDPHGHHGFFGIDRALLRGCGSDPKQTSRCNRQNLSRSHSQHPWLHPKGRRLPML